MDILTQDFSTQVRANLGFSGGSAGIPQEIVTEKPLLGTSQGTQGRSYIFLY